MTIGHVEVPKFEAFWYLGFVLQRNGRVKKDKYKIIKAGWIGWKMI